MKTAIIYASVHHKNTEKLVNAISAAIPDVLILDATAMILKDLSSYDVIGIASGIFYGKMHKAVLKFAEANLPEYKKAFVMITSGRANNSYGNDAKSIISVKNCSYLGTYDCRGFDTFGPLKIAGGLQKGHPTDEEIAGAVEFVKKITDKC